MKTLKKKFLDRFLSYQKRWLDDGARFKIGLWARQTGKDFTCAGEAVLDCFAHSHRTWLIVACGERQARESLEKAKEWALRLETEMQRKMRGACCLRTESATHIRFQNGSRILALPAKPATVRGYSGNIILTEFAFHDDPEAIWRALYPTVTNPLRGGDKKLRVITTPNGQANFFHNLWLDSPLSKHRVTIHEAHAAGLPIDLGQLKAGILSAEAWAQEYECQFIDRSTVLLPYDLIEPCESPEATASNTPEGLSSCSGELFVGIDFGRRQDLTVCWTLERIPAHVVQFSSLPVSPITNPKCSIPNAQWNSPSANPSANNQFSIINNRFTYLTREVLVLQRMPTPAQLEKLRPRIQRARRVCLDYTGGGIGLGDLLACEFSRARDKNDPGGKVELCTFTAALKEEIFAKLDGHSDRCTALALALRAAESLPPSARASNVGGRFRSRR